MRRSSVNNVRLAGVLVAVAVCGCGRIGFERSDDAAVDASFVDEWAGIVQVGGSNEDRSSGIAVDFAGNVFVSGATRGDLDGPNQGDYDAVIVKIDAGGSVSWIKQVGGPLVDYARDIAVDSAGNVIATGATSNTLGATANQGGNDVFVVSYAPDGTRRWLTTFGSAGDDQSFDLGVDATGAAVVAIQTTGDLAAPNAGQGDYAIARLSPSGVVEWMRQGGSAGSDDGHTVAVAADGTAFLVGTTTGVLDGAGGGGSDMFITRFESDGTQSWIRQRGGAGNDTAQDAQLDLVTGDIWISGSTDASFDGGTYGGMQDVHAMLFAQDGTHKLTRQFGGTGNELTFGIAPTPTGAIFACTADVGFDGQTPNGGDDVCAISIARDGTRQWTRFYGGPLVDQASSCAYGAGGFVYVSVITTGNLDGSPNRGIADIAAARIDLTGALR